MKILQLRFKNLNSLTGEWSIDLTVPAYSSEGIFAIIGPTGAGKSTILDAICLALYGRTPRLSKVTKSGNEIMSRQSGECFAEVSFETASGRYRCHWSQHRARKKSNGDLQVPKHEISNVDSGEVFETKLRGVADQVESATGMDFDRFTRSMLLAQGGFAAFLQAAADERAPILEQITGTEIYSQISMHVHETRASVRKKLDVLTAELNGMQLLGEAEEQELSSELLKKQNEELALSPLLKNVDKAIHWLEGMNKLEGDLAETEVKLNEWQERQVAFQSRQETLNKATKALELAAEFAELSTQRVEQTQELETHTKCLSEMPGLESSLIIDEASLGAAMQTLEERKVEQKGATLVFRQTREIDLKLREKEGPIHSLGEALQEEEGIILSLKGKQDEDNAVLDDKKRTLENIAQQQLSNKEDEKLIEHLAGLRNQLETLKAILSHQVDNEIEREQALAKANETEDVWQALSEQLEVSSATYEQDQALYETKQCALKDALSEQTLTDLRNAATKITARKATLERISLSFKSFCAVEDELDQLVMRNETLEDEGVVLLAKSQACTEKKVAGEREVTLLETQLSLVKTIHGFEEARRKLSDGEACPLCGSEEHPFARGNVPLVDESATALAKARERLTACADTLMSLQVMQAEAAKDVQQNIVRQNECAKILSDAKVEIQHDCLELGLDEAQKNISEVLVAQLKMCDDDVLRLTTELSKAELLDVEFNNQRDTLDHSKAMFVDVQRRTQTAAHDKDSAKQRYTRLTKEAEKLGLNIQQSKDALQAELSCYGCESLIMSEVDSIVEDLTQRRDQWLGREKEKRALEKTIAAMTLQTQHLSEKILNLSKAIKKKSHDLENLRNEHVGLQQQRQNLFGEKNPDEEESRLLKTIEESEQKVNLCRKQLSSTQQGLENIKHRVEGLTTSMTTRAEKLAENEAAFKARLNTLGFCDEATFSEACLPNDERKRLLAESQLLNDEYTALQAKNNDISRQLEAERLKSLSEKSHQSLADEQSRHIAEQKILQQDVGAIQQKLQDNAQLKQSQAARVEAIEGQKRECLRWDMLHELIGSADGKKYRNFAQGLTFDMMVMHANRQLQKMTDRYLLVRDERQALELNVIDNYQAGEMRSTKNLSGGESFIVSLALALGLSNMASKNVRVDSLFLDEGFGTLDDNALEVALETLAGLQQEGKLIGVISHVGALKERISTQIHVEPQTGGRSVITGPGCQRVS